MMRATCERRRKGSNIAREIDLPYYLIHNSLRDSNWRADCKFEAGMGACEHLKTQALAFFFIIAAIA